MATDFQSISNPAMTVDAVKNAVALIQPCTYHDGWTENGRFNGEAWSNIVDHCEQVLAWHDVPREWWPVIITTTHQACYCGFDEWFERACGMRK